MGTGFASHWGLQTLKRFGSNSRWSRSRRAGAKAQRQASDEGCCSLRSWPKVVRLASDVAWRGSVRPVSRRGWWQASQGSSLAKRATQWCSRGSESGISKAPRLEREPGLEPGSGLAHEAPCSYWRRGGERAGKPGVAATAPSSTRPQRPGGCRERFPAPPIVMATAGTAGTPVLWSNKTTASRSACRGRDTAGTSAGESSPSSSSSDADAEVPWSSCCTVTRK